MEKGGRFGEILSRIKGYDPSKIGLKEDFSLVAYAALKGWGCTVPAATLFKYLKDIGDGSILSETPDVSVAKHPHDPSKVLISTTDFFYPLIEDPNL